MKSVLYLFLLSGAVTVHGFMSNEVFLCPREFVRCGNSCYYFSNTTAPWKEAYFQCAGLAKDSNLAVLDNKWKDTSVRDFLMKTRELPQVDRWIAGIYDWQQMQWIWGTTANKVEYQGFSRRSPYDDNRWKCISLAPNLRHRWSAKKCTGYKHYICEAPSKSVFNRFNYVKYS